MMKMVMVEKRVNWRFSVHNFNPPQSKRCVCTSHLVKLAEETLSHLCALHMA